MMERNLKTLCVWGGSIMGKFKDFMGGTGA